MISIFFFLALLLFENDEVMGYLDRYTIAGGGLCCCITCWVCPTLFFAEPPPFLSLSAARVWFIPAAINRNISSVILCMTIRWSISIMKTYIVIIIMKTRIFWKEKWWTWALITLQNASTPRPSYYCVIIAMQEWWTQTFTGKTSSSGIWRCEILAKTSSESHFLSSSSWERERDFFFFLKRSSIIYPIDDHPDED